MKQTLLIVALLLTTCGVFAQVKKKPVKAVAAKQETEEKQSTPSFPESMTANIAAKYAKQMGTKMYNTDPCYGDKHTGYTFSILGWKRVRGNDNTNLYLVKVETSWKEGMGGLFGDWKDVSYKGVMMIDEFGCSPCFLITERQEFSVMGLHKRCHQLSPENIAMMSSFDEWLKDVQFGWAPQGCLE